MSLVRTSTEDDIYNISVVIPFFNAKQYFKECFESVYSQTLAPFEIIIVDDGSLPDHAQFLEQFKDRARVVHLKNNVGVGQARNEGIKLAKGNWVAFQDSDDIWSPEKLELQVSFLQGNKDYSGCHTGTTTFDDFGIKATYVDKPSLLSLKDLIKSSQVTPPSFLVSIDVLKSQNGFDSSFKSSEDYDLSIRLVSEGQKIGFVDLPLVKIRRGNHGNLSSSGLRTFVYHCKLVSKHKEKFVTEGGYKAIRLFLAKSLRECAGKVGGIRGKFIYYFGRLIGF